MMTFKEVMKALEEAGTAQTRKTYARHGAGENMFGVRFADLRKLQKQIKTDHGLARQLWTSCNLDAQWLATMIADPAQMNAKETDAWVEHISEHEPLLGAHLAAVVARNRCADQKMRKWMKSTDEFTRASAYNILTERLKNDDITLSDAECQECLRTRCARCREAHRESARGPWRYCLQNAGCYFVYSENCGEGHRVIALRS